MPQPGLRGRTPALVPLAGGEFSMGADDGAYPADGEGPVRRVSLDPFQIASVSVSNQEFAEFIAHTGYQTVAERLGNSHVFHLQLPPENQFRAAANQMPWWRVVPGACWRAPCGDYGQSSAELRDHPVVHIALQDAAAYCQWRGVKLPTEAQWEFAARGGLAGCIYPWGNKLQLDGEHRCNIWQGTFPAENTAEDGYLSTCPVNVFKPNRYGLYNMCGNVWEWTADRFTRLHSPRLQHNPAGPLNGVQCVTRGGSFLCHASYCLRYRTSSRQATNPATCASNIGFRVAL